ncbi:MAG: hypothetical protein JW776_01990 [Candidatus Lokiarchaeota archaeon]|nr:hypothetical protein [Candidatus Lokiarchaeota archaeon]
MILQTTQDILFFILWLVVATMLLGLFIWLATRWIASKTKAKDKIIMIFILALVTILLLPIIGGAVGYVLTWLDTIVGWPASQWPSVLGTGGNYLFTLVAVIQFLIFMVLVKFFINETWGNAVWIALISLFLLFLMYTLIPNLYSFLNSALGMPW